MHIVRKLMILVIIITSFVIIHRLIKENEDVRKGSKGNEETKENTEGFENKELVANKELMESAKKQGMELSIKPIQNKYYKFPLREFMIKSSYNSAIIDKTASQNAIKFVLSRGCRVLDFEIYTRNDKEYVSYSEDPEYKVIQTDLSLTVEKAFLSIAENAFSQPSPAPNDPLFIQLRIKNNTHATYKRISKLIETVFGNKYYNKPIDGSVPVGNLMQKVIFILDATSAPDYNKYSTCLKDETDCEPLTQYINLLSGTADLPKYSYTEYMDLIPTPITVDYGNDRTDVRSFMLISPPEIGGNNVSMPGKNAILKLPCQMMLARFYKQTAELKGYEKMFNECESSFCALGPFFRKSYRKNSD